MGEAAMFPLRCSNDFFSGNAVAFGSGNFFCRPHLSVHHEGDAIMTISVTQPDSDHETDAPFARKV
ncbi:hypothetical protein ACNVD4_00945, partial [Rhizobium sp. BR5]